MTHHDMTSYDLLRIPLSSSSLMGVLSSFSHLIYSHILTYTRTFRLIRFVLVLRNQSRISHCFFFRCSLNYFDTGRIPSVPRESFSIPSNTYIVHTIYFQHPLELDIHFIIQINVWFEFMVVANDSEVVQSVKRCRLLTPTSELLTISHSLF